MGKSITASIQQLTSNYPMRLTKEGPFGGKLSLPELRKVMDRNPGTPCCVQMSHALNMSGLPVPQSKGAYGGRRDSEHADFNGRTFYYLLAVDEVEKYLTAEYGPGEMVSQDEQGRKRSSRDVRKYLAGRTGILVLRDGAGLGVGFGPNDHTELWNGSGMHQPGMAEDHLLGMQRVLFWDCGPAQWLQDYMAKQ